MVEIRPTLQTLKLLRKADLLGHDAREAYDCAVRVEDMTTRLNRLASLDLSQLNSNLLNGVRSLLTVGKFPDTHKSSSRAARQTIYELRDHAGAAWRGAGLLEHSTQTLWVILALPHDHFHSEAPNRIEQMRKEGLLGPSSLDRKIRELEKLRIDRRANRVAVLSALIEALQYSQAHHSPARVPMPPAAGLDKAEMSVTVSDVPTDAEDWEPEQAHEEVGLVSVEIQLAHLSTEARRWLVNVCLPFLQPDQEMIQSVFRKSQLSIVVVLTRAKLIQMLSLDDSGLAEIEPHTPPEPSRLHYTAKASLVGAYVEGTAVRAVCGTWWIPVGDELTHSGLPVCETCETERPFAEAISQLMRNGE